MTSPTPRVRSKRVKEDWMMTPSITQTKTIKLLRVERGIAYFEDGWWMHDTDRHDMKMGKRVKPDYETKQIVIDKTIYPDAWPPKPIKPKH